jgi:hypothetical protein
MSLYIVGCLLPVDKQIENTRFELEQAAKDSGVCIRFEVTQDDLLFFSTIFSKPIDSELTFLLTDNPDSSDITTSWMVAMRLARQLLSGQISDLSSVTLKELPSLSFPNLYFQEMQKKGLGCCLSRIIQASSVDTGALWIADGEPEDFITLNPTDCEQQILKTMILPWDCLPNLAYIWKSRRR